MANSISRRMLTVGVLSGGGLLLEIALTRLLSTLYFPPYVFAVISLAILGIGLGAAALVWEPWLNDERRVPLYCSLAGAAALVLVTFLVLTASSDLRLITFALIALPYFFIGVTLATVFSAAPSDSTRLYMADLVGAGSGALLAIPLLNLAGALNAVIAAGLVLGIAGVVAKGRISPDIPAGFALVALAFLGGNLSADWLAVDMASLHSEKPIKDALSGQGRIIRTTWDAFARTDVVDPGTGAPLRLYVDGAAGSVMPRAGDTQVLLNDIGFFPFATAQPDRVLVIGPGGGLDVSFGILSQAREIQAIEVNPASVDLVREFAEVNGDLYGLPNVHVVVDEGRSALKRDDTQYDLIFLSQVITETSERSGYALTENTLYTVEAFQDYLDHLTPDGQLALKLYDEPTLIRAVSLAIAALKADGLSDADALNHLAAFVDPRADIPLLVVRKSPYTEELALADAAIAQDVGFTTVYLPFAPSQPPLDAVASGERSYASVVAESEIDISAPTDNRPFFFQFERGIPDQLLPLIYFLGGVLVLGGIYLVYSGSQSSATLPRYAPLYFAALGMGYITVQAGVIQQTRLFLGHPTTAITTVITVFLIGSGAGSQFAGQRIPDHRGTIPPLPPAGAAAALMVWLLVWPLISDSLLAAPLGLRLGMTALTLLPLAFLMGMPFSLGLRALSGEDAGHVALAWAVNGVMTVVGSVAAVVVSMQFGIGYVVILGAVIYLVAGLLAYGIGYRPGLTQPGLTQD